MNENRKIIPFPQHRVNRGASNKFAESPNNAGRFSRAHSGQSRELQFLIQWALKGSGSKAGGPSKSWVPSHNRPQEG